jgi:hypothetical protein
MHITKAQGAQRVRVPSANPEWHKVAKDWYNSLKKSGQSKFYEPSDWAYAYFLADQMSYYQEGGPKGRSSMMLTAILGGMTSLLMTEGDRRRARIELERGKPADEKSAAELAVEKYKQQLQQKSNSGAPASGGSVAAA